jgi:hypothetical protein
MKTTDQSATDIIRWKLDEWGAKTLRSLSVLDAQVFLKFVPAVFANRNPFTPTLEFFESEEEDHFYEYDERTGKYVRIEKEYDEYKRDQFHITIPYENIASTVTVEVDARDPMLFTIGNVFCVQQEDDSYEIRIV